MGTIEEEEENMEEEVLEDSDEQMEENGAIDIVFPSCLLPFSSLGHQEEFKIPQFGPLRSSSLSQKEAR